MHRAGVNQHPPMHHLRKTKICFLKGGFYFYFLSLGEFLKIKIKSPLRKQILFKNFVFFFLSIDPTCF
jgi:hypothetical protein